MKKTLILTILLMSVVFLDCAPKVDTTPVVQKSTQNVSVAEPPSAASTAAPYPYIQSENIVPREVNDPLLSTFGGWFPGQPNLWALESLGILGLFQSITLPQKEITVAIIDTGTDYTAPELAGRLWVNTGEAGSGREGNGIDDDGNGYVDDFIGWNWVNNNNNPVDDNGHGTHLAGIIGAIGGNKIGLVGIAPWVRLMSLKVCNAQGTCSSNNTRAAIRYALNHGASVINLSLGGGGSLASKDAFESLAEEAADRGVAVIVAAGNQKQDIKNVIPSNVTQTLSISAHTDQDGFCSEFSNYGLKIDLSAPGCGVIGKRNIPAILSLASKKCGADQNSFCLEKNLYKENYAFLYGTSMAAPFAAGLAAVAQTLNPALSVAKLRQVLFSSARNNISHAKSIELGMGLLSAKNILHTLQTSIGLRFLSPRSFSQGDTFDISAIVETDKEETFVTLSYKRYLNEKNVDFTKNDGVLFSDALKAQERKVFNKQWSPQETGTYLLVLEGQTPSGVFRETLPISR